MPRYTKHFPTTSSYEWYSKAFFYTSYVSLIPWCVSQYFFRFFFSCVCSVWFSPQCNRWWDINNSIIWPAAIFCDTGNGSPFLLYIYYWSFLFAGLRMHSNGCFQRSIGCGEGEAEVWHICIPKSKSTMGTGPIDDRTHNLWRCSFDVIRIASHCKWNESQLWKVGRKRSTCVNIHWQWCSLFHFIVKKKHIIQGEKCKKDFSDVIGIIFPHTKLFRRTIQMFSDRNCPPSLVLSLGWIIWSTYPMLRPIQSTYVCGVCVCICCSLHVLQTKRNRNVYWQCFSIHQTCLFGFADNRIGIALPRTRNKQKKKSIRLSIQVANVRLLQNYANTFTSNWIGYPI